VWLHLIAAVVLDACAALNINLEGSDLLVVDLVRQLNEMVVIIIHILTLHCHILPVLLVPLLVKTLSLGLN
jgi:hypothetical protein